MLKMLPWAASTPFLQHHSFYCSFPKCISGAGLVFLLSQTGCMVPCRELSFQLHSRNILLVSHHVGGMVSFSCCTLFTHKHCGAGSRLVSSGTCALWTSSMMGATYLICQVLHGCISQEFITVCSQELQLLNSGAVWLEWAPSLGKTVTGYT